MLHVPKVLLNHLLSFPLSPGGHLTYSQLIYIIAVFFSIRVNTFRRYRDRKTAIAIAGVETRVDNGIENCEIETIKRIHHFITFSAVSLTVSFIVFMFFFLQLGGSLYFLCLLHEKTERFFCSILVSLHYYAMSKNSPKFVLIFSH